MTRRENWQTLLHDAILACETKPFEWGEHDCALFVADCILAMTDIDLAADYRGKYENEAGALATIKQLTGGDTVEAVAVTAAQSHSLEEVSPKMAQRGDLMVFDLDGGPTLGIVSLNGRQSLAMSTNGIVRLRTLSAKRAWRIG